MNSTRISADQDRALTEWLSKQPRYAPPGASQWSAPEGFRWKVEDLGNQKRVQLIRKSDSLPVIRVPKYSFLVHADESLIFTNLTSAFPVLQRFDLEHLKNQTGPCHDATWSMATLYPLLDRAKLKDLKFPIASTYRTPAGSFVWSFNPGSGEFHHGEISWFNDSQPDPSCESIELLAYHPELNVLVGSGARIPNFVMSPDGKELLGFLTTIPPGSEPEVYARKVRVWHERVKNTGKGYLS